MIQVVVLDTGILGFLTNPKGSEVSRRCTQWLYQLLAAGDVVVLPEIADYEIRREFIRAGMIPSVQELDALQRRLHYAALMTTAMRQAAQFWAQVRNQARPTTGDQALDGDVILAAQATLCASLGDVVIIATTNVGHLTRLLTLGSGQILRHRGRCNRAHQRSRPGLKGRETAF